MPRCIYTTDVHIMEKHPLEHLIKGPKADSSFSTPLEPLEEIEYIGGPNGNGQREEITTPIDKIYNLVSACERTTVFEAARNLSLSEQSVERLAHMMEEVGILRVRYPLNPFGSAQLHRKKK